MQHSFIERTKLASRRWPVTADVNSAQVVADVLALIAERGYDDVTVDDLAAATGLSRSTFFRRFGSKDDVVFADHDRLLTQLTEFLAQTTLEPATALHDAARLFLDYHIGRRELTIACQDIIRANPALRDRELLLIPRYERAFAEYVAHAYPDAPGWAVSATAAGVVAVHNSVVRSWLKDPKVDAPAELYGQVGQLTTLFEPVLAPAVRRSPKKVVVTSFDSGASIEEILAAVRRDLES